MALYDPNLHFFLADIDELPVEIRGTRLMYVNNKIKYAICGVSDNTWKEYLNENKSFGLQELTEDEAIKGASLWAEVRTHTSEWTDDGNGNSQKIKREISDDERAVTVSLMKKLAKKLVEYGITKLGDSHATYNSALLTSIDNCTTMEEINIIYEDYLGDELPSTQAKALNKYDSDGNRTYSAGRVTPSFL
tara:strand:- start:2906 stop:3478 length:573 start_codon:yes stop_codon:yes gene_type:complete